MAHHDILIVGSANMDMVVTTDRFPRPGETLFGTGFRTFPGGKGANQAVACAKLGGACRFLGKLGQDMFGQELAASMGRDGVGLDHLLTDPASPTGVALITVDTAGQNQILVVSGANMRLTPSDLAGQRQAFVGIKVLLVQLEIPLETVIEAARLAREAGALVILNPAPPCALPAALLHTIDYLTPNETEAELLSGVPVSDSASARAAAARLLGMGVKQVIITLGDKGALLATAAHAEVFPARPVQALDTTAAGDAFNGALAFALASSQSLPEAIGFANSVAAYSVTRCGAQPSMPTLEQLRAFLA